MTDNLTLDQVYQRVAGAVDQGVTHVLETALAEAPEFTGAIIAGTAMALARFTVDAITPKTVASVLAILHASINPAAEQVVRKLGEPAN